MEKLYLLLVVVGICLSLFGLYVQIVNNDEKKSDAFIKASCITLVFCGAVTSLWVLQSKAELSNNAAVYAKFESLKQLSIEDDETNIYVRPVIGDDYGYDVIITTAGGTMETLHADKDGNIANGAVKVRKEVPKGKGHIEKRDGVYYIYAKILT